jgi:hypothetical protein
MEAVFRELALRAGDVIMEIYEADDFDCQNSSQTIAL